jgi:DNA-binding SARP family transcriptional activator
VAVLAEVDGGAGEGLAAALEVVLDRAGLGPHLADPGRVEVLALLAAAPAIAPADLATVGLDPGLLGAMAEATALLRPVGDGWALLELLREPVRQRLGADRLRVAAARIAPALADRDPLAAAEVLLDAGDDAGAADLLARHASGVVPEAAVPLLYRMRPEVRHQLPPLLSGARATVEMDAALAGAERRVATAGNPAERAEAQVAVGTILLHRGQLASAGAELESALRTLGHPTGGSAPIPVGATAGRPPPPAAPAAMAVASGWLGLARLWAGDLDGAAAAVAGVAAETDLPTRDPAWSLARWVAAELALTRNDLAPAPAPTTGTPPAGVAAAGLEEAGVLVADLGATGWTVAADAVAARLALAHGAEDAAARNAAQGYRAAVSAGGLDLLVVGPVHAWCLARAGRWTEALAVADELRRRLGAVDTCARLHADLIAEAHARAVDDTVAAARYGRAVATTRRLGFAPVEAVARRWLPNSAGAAPGVAGLELQVLGPVVATVDGRDVDDRAWRSRKAREVLVVLALAGEAGRGRDEVIEAVWPDRDPAKGRSLLRTALADIRRILEPSRPPGEPSRFLASHGDRLVLAARTDLATAAREHAAGDPAALAAAWRRFRGELAADDPYAESLAEARRSAGRLQADVAQGLVAGASTTASTAATTTASTIASVDPEALVDAAAFLLRREPWRDDVAEPVVAACRAAGHEAVAARAERLLGSLRPPR